MRCRVQVNEIVSSLDDRLEQSVRNALRLIALLFPGKESVDISVIGGTSLL